MKLSPFCVNLRAPFELFIGGEAKFKKMENVESIRGDGFRPCVTYTLLPFFLKVFRSLFFTCPGMRVTL